MLQTTFPPRSASSDRGVRGPSEELADESRHLIGVSRVSFCRAAKPPQDSKSGSDAFERQLVDLRLQIGRWPVSNRLIREDDQRFFQSLYHTWPLPCTGPVDDSPGNYFQTHLPRLRSPKAEAERRFRGQDSLVVEPYKEQQRIQIGLVE